MNTIQIVFKVAYIAVAVVGEIALLSLGGFALLDKIGICPRVAYCLETFFYFLLKIDMVLCVLSLVALNVVIFTGNWPVP